MSLSHAKPRENISEDFVGGDFSEDGGEVVEGLAKVFGDEVGGEAGEEGSAD